MLLPGCSSRGERDGRGPRASKGPLVRLHETFVRTAKRDEKKLAIAIARPTSGSTTSPFCIRALILAEKLKAADQGFVGVMVPTSAGCIYATLAALMSGRTPVMINYSTGAARELPRGAAEAGVPHDPHLARTARADQVPDRRRHDLPRGSGEAGLANSTSSGAPSARRSSADRIIARLPTGRRRRQRRRPVHERQREGPEGRAADAREHRVEHRGRSARRSTSPPTT